MKNRAHALAGAPRSGSAAEDYDEQGRYLYPGDVEDAMPEGELARWIANYLLETILRLVARPRGDAVYANMPIYYQRRTRKHVAPDVFYVPGIPYDRERKSYRLWEAGDAPQVVFEIVSSRTEDKDKVRNPDLYQRLGILEYYWFDPATLTLEALELDPQTGRYRPRQPKPNGRYDSPSLGLEVGIEGRVPGLYHEGQYVLPTDRLLEAAERAREEAERAREEAERAREDEQRRRGELERRVAELEKRLGHEGGPENP